MPQRNNTGRGQMRGKAARWLAMIVASLLLLAGIAVIAYPPISNAVYEAGARQASAAFAGRAQQHPASEVEELYRQMVAYNAALYESGQNGLVDAFSYEQVDFSLKEFGFDEEMIGSVSIPKMKLELPVYLGASRENLNRGAAHLSQTSLPVGGVNTNAVIAAHRGMPGANMFRYINKLAIGDAVYVTNFKETLEYQVAEIAIIKPNEIDKVLIQPGRDLVTLITCNPYGYNYERYVVYAERVAI